MCHSTCLHQSQSQDGASLTYPSGPVPAATTIRKISTELMARSSLARRGSFAESPKDVVSYVFKRVRKPSLFFYEPS